MATGYMGLGSTYIGLISLQSDYWVGSTVKPSVYYFGIWFNIMRLILYNSVQYYATCFKIKRLGSMDLAWNHAI